jgi:rsbT co-antagonist protein RsbR
MQWRQAVIQRLLHVANPDSDIQRRGQTLLIISIFLLGLLVLTIPVVLARPDPTPSIVASTLGFITVISSALLAKRGRVNIAGWLLVSLAILTVSVPITIRRDVSITLFYLLIPIVVSGVVLRPRENWIVLGAVLSVLGFAIAISSEAARADPITTQVLSSAIGILLIVGLISVLGATVTNRAFTENAQARSEAEALARKFEDLNARLEQEVNERTRELRQALANVEARDAEKQALLDQITLQGDQIREMSVPVLPVDQRTLVMPLVGALDSQRLIQVQEQALNKIEHSQARYLLLDITGVPVVDSQVAQGLISTIQAVRLLGAEPVLVGVRPEVAQSLVALGIDLTDLRTAGDLQGALRR